MFCFLLFLFVSKVAADGPTAPCDDGTMMAYDGKYMFPQTNNFCLCGAENQDYKVDGTPAQRVLSKMCNAGTVCTRGTKSCTCTPDKEHFCYYDQGPA